MAGAAGDSPLGYLVTHMNDVIYELEDAETMIGRADSNDIAIKTSKSISSQHCKILIDTSKLNSAKLVDDASLNGTFVNDVRVHNGATRLKSGDSIRFGYDVEVYRFYFPQHVPPELRPQSESSMVDHNNNHSSSTPPVRGTASEGRASARRGSSAGPASRYASLASDGTLPSEPKHNSVHRAAVAPHSGMASLRSADGQGQGSQRVSLARSRVEEMSSQGVAGALDMGSLATYDVDPSSPQGRASARRASLHVGQGAQPMGLGSPSRAGAGRSPSRLGRSTSPAGPGSSAVSRAASVSRPSSTNAPAVGREGSGVPAPDRSRSASREPVRRPASALRSGSGPSEVTVLFPTARGRHMSTSSPSRPGAGGDREEDVDMFPEPPRRKQAEKEKGRDGSRESQVRPGSGRETRGVEASVEGESGGDVGRGSRRSSARGVEEVKASRDSQAVPSSRQQGQRTAPVTSKQQHYDNPVTRDDEQEGNGSPHIEVDVRSSTGSSRDGAPLSQVQESVRAPRSSRASVSASERPSTHPSRASDAFEAVEEASAREEQESPDVTAVQARVSRQASEDSARQSSSAASSSSTPPTSSRKEEDGQGEGEEEGTPVVPSSRRSRASAESAEIGGGRQGEVVSSRSNDGLNEEEDEEEREEERKAETVAAPAVKRGASGSAVHADIVTRKAPVAPRIQHSKSSVNGDTKDKRRRKEELRAQSHGPKHQAEPEPDLQQSPGSDGDAEGEVERDEAGDNLGSPGIIVAPQTHRQRQEGTGMMVLEEDLQKDEHEELPVIQKPAHAKAQTTHSGQLSKRAEPTAYEDVEGEELDGEEGMDDDENVAPPRSKQAQAAKSQAQLPPLRNSDKPVLLPTGTRGRHGERDRGRNSGSGRSALSGPLPVPVRRESRGGLGWTVPTDGAVFEDVELQGEPEDDSLVQPGTGRQQVHKDRSRSRERLTAARAARRDGGSSGNENEGDGDMSFTGPINISMGGPRGGVGDVGTVTVESGTVKVAGRRGSGGALVSITAIGPVTVHTGSMAHDREPMSAGVRDLPADKGVIDTRFRTAREEGEGGANDSIASSFHGDLFRGNAEGMDRHSSSTLPGPPPPGSMGTEGVELYALEEGQAPFTVQHSEEGHALTPAPVLADRSSILLRAGLAAESASRTAELMQSVASEPLSLSIPTSPRIAIGATATGTGSGGSSAASRLHPALVALGDVVSPPGKGKASQTSARLMTDARGEEAQAVREQAEAILRASDGLRAALAGSGAGLTRADIRAAAAEGARDAVGSLGMRVGVGSPAQRVHSNRSHPTPLPPSLSATAARSIGSPIGSSSLMDSLLGPEGAGQRSAQLMRDAHSELRQPGLSPVPVTFPGHDGQPIRVLESFPASPGYGRRHSAGYGHPGAGAPVGVSNPIVYELLQGVTVERDEARRAAALGVSSLASLHRKLELRRAWDAWVRWVVTDQVSDRTFVSVDPATGGVTVSPSKGQEAALHMHPGSESHVRVSQSPGRFGRNEISVLPHGDTVSIRANASGAPVEFNMGDGMKTTVRGRGAAFTLASPPVPGLTHGTGASQPTAFTAMLQAMPTMPYADPPPPVADASTSTGSGRPSGRCLSPPRRVWEPDSGPRASTANSRVRREINTAAVSARDEAALRRSQSPVTGLRSIRLGNSTKACVGLASSRPGSAGAGQDHGITVQSSNGATISILPSTAPTSFAPPYHGYSAPGSSGLQDPNGGVVAALLSQVGKHKHGSVSAGLPSRHSLGGGGIPSYAHAPVHTQLSAARGVSGTTLHVVGSDVHVGESGAVTVSGSGGTTDGRVQEYGQGATLTIQGNAMTVSDSGAARMSTITGAALDRLFDSDRDRDPTAHLLPDARALAVQAILASREEQLRRMTSAADEQIIRLASAAAATLQGQGRYATGMTTGRRGSSAAPSAVPRQDDDRDGASVDSRSGRSVRSAASRSGRSVSGTGRQRGGTGPQALTGARIRGRTPTDLDPGVQGAGFIHSTSPKRRGSGTAWWFTGKDDKVSASAEGAGYAYPPWTRDGRSRAGSGRSPSRGSPDRLAEHDPTQARYAAGQTRRHARVGTDEGERRYAEAIEAQRAERASIDAAHSAGLLVIPGGTGEAMDRDEGRAGGGVPLNRDDPLGHFRLQSGMGVGSGPGSAFPLSNPSTGAGMTSLDGFRGGGACAIPGAMSRPAVNVCDELPDPPRGTRVAAVHVHGVPGPSPPLWDLRTFERENRVAVLMAEPGPDEHTLSQGSMATGMGRLGMMHAPHPHNGIINGVHQLSSSPAMRVGAMAQPYVPIGTGAGMGFAPVAGVTGMPRTPPRVSGSGAGYGAARALRSPPTSPSGHGTRAVEVQGLPLRPTLLAADIHRSQLPYGLAMA